LHMLCYMGIQIKDHGCTCFATQVFRSKIMGAHACTCFATWVFRSKIMGAHALLHGYSDQRSWVHMLTQQVLITTHLFFKNFLKLGIFFIYISNATPKVPHALPRPHLSCLLGERVSSVV
jgi:hypothetical protein